MKKKIIVFISLILMFIANVIIVLNDGYIAIDSGVHNFIMRYSSEMTNKLMHFITFFGSTKWIIILCGIIFFIFLFKKKRNWAFSSAAVLIISTVLNNVIKLIIQRPRPEYITVVEHSYSFPSGHTMAACTLYGFLIYFLLKKDVSKKYKVIFSILLCILILFVGISRIYLGAHYFSDVFSGIILSSAVIVLFDIINDKKKIV